jgi:hypothetical protein
MGALLSVLVFGVTLFAQDTAQLAGLVTDPSQAPVSGVAVSITNSSTGIAFKASSSDGGRFVFPALSPGKYRLGLKKDGFQTAIADDVELHVADRQELSFRLTLGAISQTVTVSGSTPLVNTDDGAVSIHTEITTMEQFDFGENRWDLIVLSYAGCSQISRQVEKALKPGGILVQEAFHTDALKTMKIGGSLCKPGELPNAFQGLRVLRYEEPVAKPDFAPRPARVVRFAAEKPIE